MTARAFLCLFALVVSGAALGNVTKLVQKVDSAVVVLKTQGRSVAVSGNRVKEVSAQGLGTGVLVDGEGHVVTAAHVVQIADSVVAEFVDGTEVSATVVSSDPSLDLALLKLDSVPVSAAAVKLGDSAKLQVGDEVIVIGSPFGLSHSVSTGIVSGRHSPGSKDSSLGGLTAEIIQTDAAINKGNSGGPMFNARGEVVGIVSFILSQSGGFEGIGFAVSSNTAKKALFENPMFWSGLEGIVVQGELADALNLGHSAGMLVQKVATGSLAASLGLKPGKVPVKIQGRDIMLGGDIIVSVEGVELNPETIGEVREKMKQLSPNDRLKIEVKRAGRLIVLQAVLPPNQ